VPAVSSEAATLYEHCVRVLKHADRVGPHGLPLMGTGDWNDGMNKVGAHGRGESVWNEWFILTVLKAFAELADRRGDTAQAAWCRERAEGLRAALEANAWDGAWYRRAYFDDGTPLGSAANDECQIDALPQAWSVISGAGDLGRSRQAMAAVDERLVDPAGKLIRLFTPPFDRGALEPGYIKGYVPATVPTPRARHFPPQARWPVRARRTKSGRSSPAYGKNSADRSAQGSTKTDAPK
jgi:cellobiose phosphorylase